MPSEKPPLNEAQRYKRYRQLLKYKVECRLSNAENYCKKYDGSPCCYFCDEKWKDEKEKCEDACENEPYACNHYACVDKK